jgi:hypothetical protein
MYLALQDEMLETPQDSLPSRSIHLDSDLRGCTSAPPDQTGAHSDGPASSPSPSQQQIAPPTGKARRNKIKREKWKEKSKCKGVEPKSRKKREASAMRLAARLAGTQSAVASPFSISSLPKNRSGFGGSQRDADKEQAARLGNDLGYFREVVRSLRPVPYE